MSVLAKLLLGNQNEKIVRRLQGTVDRINALEPETKALSDADLAAKTVEFKGRLANGEPLGDLLPEAFACVREAAIRTLGQRHFDAQLMGSIVLHEGNIAEMKTGEGKTLAATAPVYLNALTGAGVHLVTVNDYLAARDADWMGQIYRFLGLTVGKVVHEATTADRHAAYRCDVTYGTNNEFGFDYLRDNMAWSPTDMAQRPLNYAIVDEVDSILIDEARTPLIISGVGQKSTDEYYRFARVAPRLVAGVDYEVDEKAHTVSPTETGVAKAEKMLGVKNLYADGHDLSRYLMAALRAHALYRRDRDYVVKDGEVIIVDEFTGRLMFGRRWSDGLHQAVEAKEGVKIERENQTLATITLQNYFRMYKKLAGMTGTAATEEEEFKKIYGMDVVVIPTNKPMVRADHPDVVYRTQKGKFKAVVEEIVEAHATGQPVLVGTVSIEKSEIISQMLDRRGIQHSVLNAKHHEKEAEIIAKAGEKGTVTVATNMAGRGVDIKLAEGVPQLGGLRIIGTERHESRRIDNQLRGRSGRQGDPGESRFYISLEDDLMRLFGSESLGGILDRLGMDDDMPIENRMVTKAIETAQKRVEARNFELRKHVLEYDDVMNEQRRVIYESRHKALEQENLRDNLFSMVDGVCEGLLDQYCSRHAHIDDWDLEGLVAALEEAFMPKGYVHASDFKDMPRDALKEALIEAAQEVYGAKEKDIGPETMRQLERYVLLRVVDEGWMAHLDAMDDLRDGIGLRAYAQRDPLVEYKHEAYEAFQSMIQSIQENTVRNVFKLTIVKEPEKRQVVASGPGDGSSGGGAVGKAQAATKKVGRNDPCPCGSGKKYKKCCGRTA